ncbi:hypothetical protein Tco_0678703 [Tanacetum coccineum]|uniref:Uncharacterized protein n=1 Tax=Tanacetum coccineum TaxID=301880 RepID=A0ABQ4XFZ3_9ASTR
MTSYPTILEPDTISSKAWVRLKDIFQDNKNSRTVYLEHQFTNTRLKHFSLVSAYCQELKILLGQLSKVEAPYFNNRPVLQLIFGLNESHDNVVRFIQQSDLILPFEARFKLILEETHKNKQAENAAKKKDLEGLSILALWGLITTADVVEIEVVTVDVVVAASIISTSNIPTDIDQVIHTMSPTPLDDQWNMDTGATLHMTASQVTISSFSQVEHS